MIIYLKADSRSRMNLFIVPVYWFFLKAKRLANSHQPSLVFHTLHRNFQCLPHMLRKTGKMMRDWGEKLFFAEVFEITFLDKDMLIVYKVTCKHHSMC